MLRKFYHVPWQVVNCTSRARSGGHPVPRTQRDSAVKFVSLTRGKAFVLLSPIPSGERENIWFTNVSWNPHQAEGHSFYCSSELVSKTDRTQFVSAGAGTTRRNTIITIDYFYLYMLSAHFFLVMFVENSTRNMPILSNFNLREFRKKFRFLKIITIF